MNYVFYDLETTGLNPNFDQPIQIAAILVNENLDIIDEPINEICRINEGVIADPRALMINKVDIDVLNSAQSFYDFMDCIQQKFSSWSPAVFVGYNSISFDEEFMRNHLFQSLHEPYLTNTNNNSRADIYKMVLGLEPLGVDAIKFPKNKENRKISFKLVDIARENNVTQEKAHDALSDVYATIGVAKLIKENAPDYWDECMKTINPMSMHNYLESDSLFFAAPMGTTQNEYTPISYLINNPEYLKELAFFDLRYDPLKYCDKKSQIISSMIGKIGQKNKPIRILKTNNSPIILSSSYIKQKNIYTKEEISEYNKKSEYVTGDEFEGFRGRLEFQLKEKLQAHHGKDRPHELEKQLYGGPFFSDSDKAKMKIFKNIHEPHERYKLSKEFEDKRLREISYRIIFSECPDILPDEKQKERKQFIHAKVFSTTGKEDWCTIDKAKDELAKIKDSNKYVNHKDYIDEIEKYIHSEEEKYKSYSS